MKPHILQHYLYVTVSLSSLTRRIKFLARTQEVIASLTAWILDSMESGNFDNTQHHRVVAYFDVDCFYAQAEVLRRPYLQDRPVGVTQKFLVVTCNYVARQLGVPKMASIQEAKQRCPDLVLINGEDLTPYRAASKNIMAVLGRFGVLERRGLDEAALDITIEVLKRSASMPSCLGFSGHVLGLKGLGESGLEMSVPSYLQDVDPIRSDYYLMVGSQLVAEIRAAVEKETGYRCSSGIAINKMLAKLVSSVNKPNKQTCILESAVSSFLESLHVRKLPGIGHQTESVLKDMGITTVADLQQITFQHLSRKFGNRMGMLLYNSCRGVDNSLVQNKGPPKSLSVEDSFQPCTSFKQAEEIIRSLAPDLIARLDEDKEEHSRRPKVFTVKWRYPGNWAFKSASAPMPLELLSASVPLEKRLETVVEVAVKLLSHSLGRQSFSLVVLNIGATSFTVSSSASSGASHDIRSFLHSPGQSSKQLSKVMSKREARVYREECEKEKANAKLVRPLFGNLGRDGALHGRRVQTHSYNILEMEEQNCELDSDEEERAPKLYNDLSFMEQPFLVHGQPFLVHGIPQERLEASRDLRSSSYSHSPVSSTHESTLHKESPSKASSDAPPSSSSVMVDHATCSSMINDVALDNVIGTLNPNMARVEENSTALASLSQERLVESITYSNGIPLDSVALHHSDFVCEACGQELRGDAQSKQEHDDYHLALDWTSQEQSLLKSFAKPYPSPSITLRGTKKKNKATREHQLLLKRRKMQNGTLDCFVYRSQG